MDPRLRGDDKAQKTNKKSSLSCGKPRCAAVTNSIKIITYQNNTPILILLKL
jgi:hypothetical protein